MTVNSSEYPSWGDAVWCQSRKDAGKQPNGRIVDIDKDSGLVRVEYYDCDDRQDFHEMDFVGSFVGRCGGYWLLD